MTPTDRTAGLQADSASLARSGIIDASSFWVPQYVCVSAWLAHAPFLFWLIGRQHPGVFVELGAHSGFSYFAACQAVRGHGLATKCYAVDTWLGDQHSGFYGEEVFDAVARHNGRSYSAFSSLIRSTFDEAVGHFSDGSVDLLHIDGSHRYEDVRRDFEAWLPKVSSSGMVMLHDTNVRERGFGVGAFFDELTRTYPTFEFSHGHGLGLVQVGSAMSDGLRHLFDMEHDGAAAVAVRSMYSRLGDAVEHACWRGVAEQDAHESQRLLDEARRTLNEAGAHSTELTATVERLHAEVAEWSIKTRRLEFGLARATQKPYMGMRHLFRHPAPAVAALSTLAKALRDRRLLSGSTLLDPAWYTLHYREVESRGVSPAFHYLTIGAHYGHDPGPQFSTSDYLSDNLDVADAGLNPLAHYLRSGAREGRQVRPSRLVDSDTSAPEL